MKKKPSFWPILGKSDWKNPKKSSVSNAVSTFPFGKENIHIYEGFWPQKYPQQLLVWMWEITFVGVWSLTSWTWNEGQKWWKFLKIYLAPISFHQFVSPWKILWHTNFDWSGVLCLWGNSEYLSTCDSHQVHMRFNCPDMRFFTKNMRFSAKKQLKI